MRRFLPARAANSKPMAAAAVFALLASAASLSATLPVYAQGKPAPAAQEKRHKPTEPPAPAAAAAAEETPVDPLVEQLKKAGVRTCLPKMTELGKKTLPGVAGYARAANWQTRTPDDRLSSVILGQAYPETSPLPKAFAMLFGAPSGKTKCDGYSVHVIPTKDKCSVLQTKVLIRGKKIGELSGIPLLNDSTGSEVLLLPSAGDGCVLVGIRIDYAE